MNLGSAQIAVEVNQPANARPAFDVGLRSHVEETLIGVSRFVVILQPRAGAGEREVIVGFERVNHDCALQTVVRVARPMFVVFDLGKAGDGQRLFVVEFDGGVKSLDRVAEFARSEQRGSEQRERARIERVGGDHLRRVFISFLQLDLFDQREAQTQPRLFVGLILFEQAAIDFLGLDEVSLAYLDAGAFERFAARLGHRGGGQENNGQQGRQNPESGCHKTPRRQ
ncbi:MAG: hypothetical protein JMDDDDMK_02803 [Acidobacteria bacterium]|nr:hypothetical protein [Acidobacteriota bacterium]